MTAWSPREFGSSGAPQPTVSRYLLKSTMSYGLLDKASGQKVALKDIRVRASIRGYVASVKSTLQYHNDGSSPIEAVFVFPVDDLSAICSFAAVIDGRRVVGQLKEKEAARTDYDDAIASGQSAFLAEEKTGDIFRISVGNLPPGGKADVELGYVSELRTEADGGVLFNLPTVLTPRYVPSGDGAASSADAPTAEAALITAPSSIPYSLDFEATVSGAGYSTPPTVTSPCHKLDVSSTSGGQVVKVSEKYDFESDIVLIVHPRNGEQNKAFAVVEAGTDPGLSSADPKSSMMTGPVVALNFTPAFNKRSSKRCELLFVVDRSSSMEGVYINAAREALLLFLKGIPTGCRFNVIGFGSSYKCLFKKSVAYDQKSLDKATQHASLMQADLGGTELLEPLKFIFGQSVPKGYSRQVFVLTDGSVSNTSQVMELVERNASTAR